jgi:cation diffusion facilitator family transporter
MVAASPHRHISYRLLLTTLWVTLLVLGVEAIAGWTQQSLLLLAEALHTLIDAFGAGLGLLAINTSQRPLGREVIGHGRTEVVSSFLVVAFLGFTGLNLLWAALQQGFKGAQQTAFIFPATMDAPLLGVLGTLIALLPALALYVHTRSRRLGSVVLNLNARHVLADAWLSGLTLLSLGAIWQGYAWVDPLMAVILLPFAARSLWRLLNSHVPLLLRPMAIAPEAIAHLVTPSGGGSPAACGFDRGAWWGDRSGLSCISPSHPDFLGIAHIVGERAEAALRQQYGPMRTQIWVEAAQPPPTAYLDHPDTPWPQTPSTESDWS